MRRINLLAASALALALAVPAYAQTVKPDTGNKMEQSKPADNPAATDKGAMPGTSTDKATPGSSADKAAPGASTDKKAAADKTTTQPGGFITQQATTQKMAGDIIGMNVENAKKDKIGKVSDLILDDQNRVVGAVVSVGGFLGIGDKHVALAWNDLQVQGTGTDQVAMVAMTKDQLKSAPAFKTQSDMKSDQEAERKKLEQPKSGGGSLGGGSTGTSH